MPGLCPRTSRATAWLLAAAAALCPGVHALKHNYRTKHDGRSLIGPIGFPFGFTDTGHYNLTVFDFDLSVGVHSDSQDPGLYHAGFGYGDGYRDRRSLGGLDDIRGVGFLLKRFRDEGAFNHYMDALAANRTRCAFAPFLEANGGDDDLFFGDDWIMDDNAFGYDDDGSGEILNDAGGDGIFLDMKPSNLWAPYTASVVYDFEKGEEGLYFLIFQICPQPEVDIHAQFELDFHFSNLDVFSNESFLSAGEMPLPHMFFYFSLLYAICVYLWISNIRLIGEGEPGHWAIPGLDMSNPASKPIIYPIHHLMTVLLSLKFLALFFESIRYHFLRVTGKAVFWSGIYYTFAFLKGTFLFTVILLLGSGWSFVKPFLSDREKNMACLILGLQVINNIAIVVLTQETEGENAFDRWTAILHLVDIICCCAVLIPIVWQVNALEKNMEQSGDHNDVETIDLQDDTVLPENEFEDPVPSGDSRLASKLKLFRSFYLMVVGYIYVTRIIVYLFATMLDYRHTWLRHFVVEAVTLAFYASVFWQFRPMPENPYLAIQNTESGSSTREVELPSKPSKMKD